MRVSAEGAVGRLPSACPSTTKLTPWAPVRNETWAGQLSQSTASPRVRMTQSELRNRIYDFFSDSASIEPALGTQTAQRYRIVLASSRLLLICRQLRHEASPLQHGFKYHHLNLKMEARDIPDLVDLIGPSQCAEICRIEMYMSLASSIHRRVKQETAQGPFAGPWARFGGGSSIFRSLRRIVVTYPINLNSDAMSISRSLQTMFGNTDLEPQRITQMHVRVHKWPSIGAVLATQVGKPYTNIFDLPGSIGRLLIFLFEPVTIRSDCKNCCKQNITPVKNTQKLPKVTLSEERGQFSRKSPR
ncbi:hypothetical protein EJ07DRAFT_156511 [Lizonia empirigonia]|nr:hypothetical protein EJ07DRAFT_156511 [Lizonia empirigonia]